MDLVKFIIKKRIIICINNVRFIICSFYLLLNCCLSNSKYDFLIDIIISVIL